MKLCFFKFAQLDAYIRPLFANSVTNNANNIIDDEYESSNIASQKEMVSISGNINLNHTRHTHLSATK